MSKKCYLCALIVGLCFGESLGFGQEGVSSMSVGMSRAGVAHYDSQGRYVMPDPEFFRVEEYINYHRHDLPLPANNCRVHLDVQQFKLDSGKMVYQIGLTTPRALDPELIPPLNLVLVIDRSGSMSGDRIARVKESIHELVKKLRKTDRVTIVGFANEARVHLEASEKTKKKKIKAAIDSIVASGSTNLHAGLMKGYQEALAHYHPEKTNRVILLTDGRTNTGQVDLDVIARESKNFNQEGIDLSTIGLGNDLNHELLRKLADSGRGLAHFVGDTEDIEKIFVREVDSLLAPAAKKVRLAIDFGEKAEGVKIFGYRPAQNGSLFTLELDDLNHGATQVVVARAPKKMAGQISATLQYTDAITRKKVELTTASDAERSHAERNPSVPSAKKNYAIALIANAMRQAAKLSNDGKCQMAERKLRKGMTASQRLLDPCSDDDVERMMEIAENYHRHIRDSIARNRD